MNIALWILQILLALHTAIGAVWKFSHSAHTVSSLKAIPHDVWLSMSVIELLLALALILPAFYKPLAILSPIAAVVIAVEMLFFCGLNLSSSNPNLSEVMYWLVVAAICALIAYGRFVLKPL